MEREAKEFNGHTYYRYPSSRHKHLSLYYWPSRTDREKHGLESLHREIWKSVHGPIPEGCLIHHVDENKLNNDPGNLECVTRQKHAELHPQGQPEWLMEHLDRIRPKTKAWHQSEEGRAWHRRHGKATWEGREPAGKVCAYCHKEFETLADRENVRFCSRRCWREWHATHKTYHVEADCPICGRRYSASRFQQQKTCSKKCAAYWRARQKRNETEPL